MTEEIAVVTESNPKQQLLDYLQKPESDEFTPSEVSRMFPGITVEQARKARKRLKKTGKLDDQAPTQDSALDEADAALPPEDAAPASDPSSAKPVSLPLPEGIVRGLQTIRVDSLDLDSGTMIRDLDEDRVELLASVIDKQKSTDGLGPLGVMWATDLARLVLFDGFHRQEAIGRTLGMQAAVQINLKVGTLREAIGEAFRANRKHGLPLSQADRVAIIRKVLDDPLWGPRGENWSNSKIATLTGEPGRELIAKVRKEWLKEQKMADPETRKVERNGQVYEQKVPNPRGEDDAAEADELPDEDETDEAPTEEQQDRKARIEAEYLQAIPCRAHLHPNLIPAFDKAALAYHTGLTTPMATINNWIIRNKAVLGQDHPLWVQVDKLGRISAPMVVGDEKKIRKQWLACKSCQQEIGPATIVSTGRDPADPEKTCATCSGTGFRIPGVR